MKEVEIPLSTFIVGSDRFMAVMGRGKGGEERRGGDRGYRERGRGSGVGRTGRAGEPKSCRHYSHVID